MKGLRAAYTGRLLDKYKRIKTVSSPDSPVLLRDIFTHVTLESEPSIRRDFNVLRWNYEGPLALESPTLRGLLALSRHMVIIGQGGGGKSSLLRHLLLEAIQGETWLPVYLPLRRLAWDTDASPDLSAVRLMDTLWSTAIRDGLDMARDTFDEFARWGQLVFFLDGLDEVPPGDAGVAAQAIADLRDRFSDCPMVVTSRPFKDALAWDSFRVLRIAPMSREQSLALIDRVAPDGDRKRDFAAFLSDAGEARVSGLLSNPLLAHLMFMTYDEWRADASPYVFYRHVLRTLFRDQDNRKPNFQRATRTGLHLDELEAPLEGIAIQLALAGESTFSGPEVERVLAASEDARLREIEGGVDGLLEDLEKTVGVVTKERGRYEFIHPSLVDYLAARFVVRQEPDTVRELVSAFTYRLWRPDVVRLVRDVGPLAYERCFLLPELKQIVEAVDRFGADGRALLRACALRVEVLEEDRIALTWGNLGRRIAALGAMHIARARLIGTGRFGSEWISASQGALPPSETTIRWNREALVPDVEGPADALSCWALIEELEWQAARAVVAIRDLAYQTATDARYSQDRFHLPTSPSSRSSREGA